MGTLSSMSRQALIALFALFVAYAAASTGTVDYFTDKDCKTPGTNTTWFPACAGLNCATFIKGFEAAGLKKGAKCTQKVCSWSFTGVKTGSTSCPALAAEYKKLGCVKVSGGFTPQIYQKTVLNCSGASQLTLGLFSFFVVALNLFK